MQVYVMVYTHRTPARSCHQCGTRSTRALVSDADESGTAVCCTQPVSGEMRSPTLGHVASSMEAG